MQISIIKNAGSVRANAVLAGAYGSCDEQQKFVIAPELTQVSSIFAGMMDDRVGIGTQIDPNDMLHIDVPDQAGSFVKALLLNNMSRRWDGLYASMLEQLGEGRQTQSIAAAALASESAHTLRQTQNILQGQGMSLYEVPVRMKATCNYSVNYEDEISDVFAVEVIRHMTPMLHTMEMPPSAADRIEDLGANYLGRNPEVVASERAQTLAQQAIAAIAAAATLPPQTGGTSVREQGNPADVDDDVIDQDELRALFGNPQAPQPAAASTHTTEQDNLAESLRNLPPETPQPPRQNAIAIANLNQTMPQIFNQYNLPQIFEGKLVADIEYTMYIPARSAQEAAQMTGLLRYLGESVQDPVFTKLLTPTPLALHNLSLSQVPNDRLTQNQSGIVHPSQADGLGDDDDENHRGPAPR